MGESYLELSTKDGCLLFLRDKTDREFTVDELQLSARLFVWTEIPFFLIIRNAERAYVLLKKISQILVIIQCVWGFGFGGWFWRFSFVFVFAHF